ncbi:MAG: hypothetical protein RJB38_1265 [Pseudomonadota bacterium]|jgi:hypothetical protein
MIVSKLKRHWIFVFWALLLLYQAATLGISDDEAYYWVLSRKPAIGYVYHPPMVAWVIALIDRIYFGFHGFFERILGIELGALPFLPREILVRLPALIMSGLSVALAIDWIKRALPADGPSRRGPLIWLLVPGLAASSWMMVPDHSLILGWTLSFWGTWRLLEAEHSDLKGMAAITGGVIIGMLSKFSALLFVVSSAGSILIFSKRKLVPLALIGVSAALGVLPSILWNAQNDWASFTYQFVSRHSGAQFEGRRYGLFWLSQLLFAGPIMAGVFYGLLRFRADAVIRASQVARKREGFLLLWFLPSLIFLIQPAFSAFKPHWALICWIPAGLWICTISGNLQWNILNRVHQGYLIVLLSLSFGVTQWPLVSAFRSQILRAPVQPLLDLSQDLRGWQRLTEFLDRHGVADPTAIIGSRYQTAAQAAFSVWPRRAATLAPRTAAESLEWPDFSQSLQFSSPSPRGWPELRETVVYLADDRYLNHPEFPNARCRLLDKLEELRWGYRGKGIHIWLCSPAES